MWMCPGGTNTLMLYWESRKFDSLDLNANYMCNTWYGSDYICMPIFCIHSGVSGEGSGVTVKGSLVAEPVATPPAADTKASFFLVIDISTVVLVS